MYRTHQQGHRLVYRGDEFVILVHESDLQWFAKELHAAQVVKVRGVLDGC